MNELTKAFLLQLGISKDVIETLGQEEAPEDFNTDDITKSYFEKRREMTLNDAETIKALKQRFNKEQYPAIYNPIAKTIRDLTGMSKEEFEGLKEDGKDFVDLKKALGIGMDKVKTQGNASVDEIQKQVFDLKAQLESEKEIYTANVSQLEQKHQSALHRNKVTAALKNIIGTHQVTIKEQAVNSLMENQLLSRYDFRFNEKGGLSPFTLDGHKAKNDKDFLTTEQVVKSWLDDELGILKKSNGGDPPPAGGNGNPPRKIVAPEGESEAAKAMRERIEKARGN